MNCKQIREAIDTSSRHTLYSDSVSSHLNGCSDCHHHANELSSLFTLLSAQPRVEAPADFDFKVRAAIARAQSEKAAPASLLQSLQAAWKTFSWAQAVPAMAAAAVVAASTFYFNQSDSAPSPTSDVAAVRQVDAPAGKLESAPVKSQVVAPVSAVNSTSKSVKARSASLPAILKDKAPAARQISDVASIDKSSRVYNPETGQFVRVPKGNAYGAEQLSLNSPTLVASTF